MSHPTCFVSYSWDSPVHRDWVRKLATRLQEGGVEIRLDQWDVKPGVDVLRYMETSVRDSQYVLLVCTPTFATKANAGKGGVGYEKAIVSAEVFENANTEKFIPVIRTGTPTESLPSYIKSRVFLDFSEDSRFEAALEDLLRVMHGKPLFTPPPIGPVPDFQRPSTLANRSSAPSLEDFQKLFEFAWQSHGLNLPSREDARAWTEAWVRSGRSLKDLERIRAVFEFAYGSEGLNLASRQEAFKWAEMWLERYNLENFGHFRKAFLFAYSSDGLNMTSRTDAAAWALSKIDESRTV